MLTDERLKELREYPLRATLGEFTDAFDELISLRATTPAPATDSASGPVAEREWLPVGETWPAPYRMVLVATDQFQGSAPAVNVGYMKYAAGDKDSPYFVCPGAQMGFRPLWWSDCLGDTFAPPNWQMKQPLTTARTAKEDENG